MSLIKGFTKASKLNPKTMLIFSLPKAGKTHAFSKLEDHLILDFDPNSPTGYYDCNSVAVADLKTFVSLIKELKEDNLKFKYGIIDTITSAFDTVIRSLAINAYNKDESDNKPFSWDITVLAYGKGYTYLKKGMKIMIDMLQPFFEYLIISGHVADKHITKDNEDILIKTIDLPGKLKNIMAVSVDAIGMFYRGKDNVCYLSFEHNEDETEGGTRSKHLSNKVFKISEMTYDDNGDRQSYVTHWDKIFI